MDWYIVRHPETKGVGVIPPSSLDIHKALGWVRVGAVDEGVKDHVVLDDYAEAEDLDAPKPVAIKSLRQTRKDLGYTPSDIAAMEAQDAETKES